MAQTFLIVCAPQKPNRGLPGKSHINPGASPGLENANRVLPKSPSRYRAAPANPLSPQLDLAAIWQAPDNRREPAHRTRSIAVPSCPDVAALSFVLAPFQDRHRART